MALAGMHCTYTVHCLNVKFTRAARSIYSIESQYDRGQEVGAKGKGRTRASVRHFSVAELGECVRGESTLVAPAWCAFSYEDHLER